jgi:hypothetical protein
MTRLLLILFLTTSIKTYSQNKEKRKVYDVYFASKIEQIDFDNYLFGKIKTIKYEGYIYENGNESNGLTLNKLYRTHYDQQGKLQKKESYNTNRDLQFTYLNFGDGFDFQIHSESNIVIDSISKTITEIDFENGNQTIIYHLDSNYKVKSIDNIIGDSLKLYYFKTYDNNKLMSEIHRNKSMFYVWEKDGKLQRYEMRKNLKKFKPNFELAPEYTKDLVYKNDTILISENSDNRITEYKLLKVNDIVLPIYEKNDFGIKTYFYNNDFSLYKMEYTFEGSSKIIYSYKLDSYGNWLRRFDNGNETYIRKLTYDIYGNWITSEVRENGKKTEIINRDITYY